MVSLLRVLLSGPGFFFSLVVGYLLQLVLLRKLGDQAESLGFTVSDVDPGERNARLIGVFEGEEVDVSISNGKYGGVVLDVILNVDQTTLSSAKSELGPWLRKELSSYRWQDVGLFGDVEMDRACVRCTYRSFSEIYPLVTPAKLGRMAMGLALLATRITKKAGEHRPREQWRRKRLSSSVECGDLHAVQFAVQQGADGLMLDEDGGTLLHALLNDLGNDEHDYYVAIARILLDLGVDPNKSNSTGETALLLAAQCGFSQVMELLLEAGADPNVADAEGDTPLHQATWHERETMVELLLQNGADVNAQNTKGESVLSQTRDEDIVALLKAAGAT